MEFSVATPRFTAPTPNTNSINSANVHPINSTSIQNFGSGSNINPVESVSSPITMYPASRTVTIPAISYNLLRSSSNKGKTPLDLLLANPIQFVKASVMSPVYKRTQQEAFAFMPTKKISLAKKPPSMTLVTSYSRTEHVEAPQQHVPAPHRSSITHKDLGTKPSMAVEEKLNLPKITTKATIVTTDHIVCSGLDVLPPTHRRSIIVLATKEKLGTGVTSDTMAAAIRTETSPSSSSRRARNDEIMYSPPQKSSVEAAEIARDGDKTATAKATVPSSASSGDKPINGDSSGAVFSPQSPGFSGDAKSEDLGKPMGSSSHKPINVLTNGNAAVLPPKEVPKKRKADDSGTNPQAQKLRKDFSGNSSTKQKPGSAVIDGKPPAKQTASPLVSGMLPALQPGFRVKGFRNRMNDCYRNSILQLFCSSSVFRDEIKTHNSKKCKIGSCVCCGLASLFESHHYKTQANGRTRTNDAIVDVMRLARILPKNFRSTRQEDATEYFHAILHCGKDQLTKGLKGDAAKNNPIDKTFGGSFPSVLTCPKCKHRSFNKADSPSLMLQPAVKPGQNRLNNVINLKDLLDDFFIPEKVDATCEKCKHNKKKFIKQVEIERLPKFLVLNVMRWTSACLRGGYIKADKIMNRLKYEERITMKEGEKDVHYMLHAVVAHSGRSLSGGHYIAFVRQPDGTWATCNDNYVDQTTWPTVARADGLQASILGYQRVE